MSNINTGIADGGHASVKWSAMIKPLIVLVAVAALLLAAIYGWQSFVGRMMKKGMAAAATAPQVVSAIAAKPTVWQSQLHAVGSLRAVRGADLAAEIGGVVDALNFDSGNQVQAGAVLLRLRLNDDPAKLLQLQAAAELAEQNYKRDQEQFAAQAISQAVLDSDASTLKSARAAVTAQQALIGEKIVKAPFAGRLGIRQVDLGQYLSPGTTIVTNASAFRNPSTKAIGTAPGLPAGPPLVSMSHSCWMCAPRPVKSPISVGSCVGRGTAVSAAGTGGGCAADGPADAPGSAPRSA